MTTSGDARKQRGAYVSVLVVIALSLAAFFAQLGLGISFAVLALGLATIGIGQLIRAVMGRERPAGD
jgi:hypothetical protein